MAEVHTLPGIERAPSADPAPVDAVLQSALDAGLRDVAIVGRQINGDIVVWGSNPDADAAVGLLVRGANWLAAAEQVQDEDIA